MGKTAFSGPVYGAKSLLWNVSKDNVTASTGSTATVTIRQMAVPLYEDWYITEFRVFRGSTGSTGFIGALLDDSTQIASVAITSSLAAQFGSTTLTADAGEYEGVRVAAGSTMSLTLSNSGSSVVSSSDVGYSVYGYIRWISSTRAES